MVQCVRAVPHSQQPLSPDTVHLAQPGAIKLRRAILTSGQDTFPRLPQPATQLIRQRMRQSPLPSNFPTYEQRHCNHSLILEQWRDHVNTTAHHMLKIQSPSVAPLSNPLGFGRYSAPSLHFPYSSVSFAIPLCCNTSWGVLYCWTAACSFKSFEMNFTYIAILYSVLHFCGLDCLDRCSLQQNYRSKGDPCSFNVLHITVWQR